MTYYDMLHLETSPIESDPPVSLSPQEWIAELYMLKTVQMAVCRYLRDTRGIGITLCDGIIDVTQLLLGDDPGRAEIEIGVSEQFDNFDDALVFAMLVPPHYEPEMPSLEFSRAHKFKGPTDKNHDPDNSADQSTG